MLFWVPWVYTSSSWNDDDKPWSYNWINFNGNMLALAWPIQNKHGRRPGISLLLCRLISWPTHTVLITAEIHTDKAMLCKPIVEYFSPLTIDYWTMFLIIQIQIYHNNTKYAVCLILCFQFNIFEGIWIYSKEGFTIHCVWTNICAFRTPEQGD